MGFDRILFSEWVPSESKQLIKTSENIQNCSKQNILVETLCEKTTEDLFPLKEALFSIMGSYFSQKQWFEVKNILMMDFFLTNVQLLTSQDNTLIYGLEWCGSLVDHSDVYLNVLDSHSDDTAEEFHTI